MVLETRFGTIYADPPWPERGGGRIKRGADRHYPLMSVKEIVALAREVQAKAAPDSHLYLWVTNNYLPAGFQVMEAWGFTYKTIITWAKDKIGLGQYYRGQTEHCLFGVRGKPGYKTTAEGKRAQGRTLIMYPRMKHSQKPPTMREWIELVSPGPYLEMFQRPGLPRVGWSGWGNQAMPEVPVHE